MPSAAVLCQHIRNVAKALTTAMAVALLYIVKYYLQFPLPCQRLSVRLSVLSLTPVTSLWCLQLRLPVAQLESYHRMQEVQKIIQKFVMLHCIFSSASSFRFKSNSRYAIKFCRTDNRNEKRKTREFMMSEKTKDCIVQRQKSQLAQSSRPLRLHIVMIIIYCGKSTKRTCNPTNQPTS